MFNFFCKFIKAFWHKIGIKRLESSRFLGILDIDSTERCLILLIFVTTDIHMLSKKKGSLNVLLEQIERKGLASFTQLVKVRRVNHQSINVYASNQLNLIFQ